MEDENRKQESEGRRANGVQEKQTVHWPFAHGSRASIPPLLHGCNMPLEAAGSQIQHVIKALINVIMRGYHKLEVAVPQLSKGELLTVDHHSDPHSIAGFMFMWFQSLACCLRQTAT